MTRIMEWSAKLVKSLNSRKYKIETFDKDQLKGILIVTYEKTLAGFEPSSQLAEKPSFKFQ